MIYNNKYSVWIKCLPRARSETQWCVRLRLRGVSSLCNVCPCNRGFTIILFGATHCTAAAPQRQKGREARRMDGRASEVFCIVRRSCIVNQRREREREREREFAAPCSRFLIYCSAASLRPCPLDGMSPNFPSFGKGRSSSSPFRQQVKDAGVF